MTAVDVIIPTRNRAHLCKQAVRSVLRQGGADVRVLVVDDASDDPGVDELIDAFAATPSVSVIPLLRRLGPAGARQHAFDYSDAPLIALLDSDDVWQPTKLEKQLAILDVDPVIDVVLCGHEWLDASGRPARSSIPVADHMGRVTPLATDNMDTPLMRREIVTRAGGFAPVGARYSTCETIDFHVRLSAIAQYAVVPEILVSCRAHAGERASDQLASDLGASELVDLIERRRTILEQHPSDLARLEMRAAARLATAGRRRDAVAHATVAMRLAPIGELVGLARMYLPSITRNLVRPQR